MCTDRYTRSPGSPDKEYVYGQIKVQDGKKDLKYIFKNPEAIADDDIRTAVLERLATNDGNVSATLKQLKKSLSKSMGEP